MKEYPAEIMIKRPEGMSQLEFKQKRRDSEKKLKAYMNGRAVSLAKHFGNILPKKKQDS